MNIFIEKFWLELPPDTPAFLCERVGVELELCRVADMTIVEDLSRQRRSMLYVSRGQLKKHSSTALNVSVSVRYIAQQVILNIDWVCRYCCCTSSCINEILLCVLKLRL